MSGVPRVHAAAALDPLHLNRGDWTLQKVAFNLRRHFNATDLGFEPQVGDKLRACYDFEMRPYEVAATHPHKFVLYAQDPKLAQMLRDSGVDAE